MKPSIAIVGLAGGPNVGSSFLRAGQSLEIPCQFFDARTASDAPWWLQALSWRLWDRRPPRMRRFARGVLRALERNPVDLLITTGMAPLDAVALRRIRATGARLVNFSTDDPWNPGFQARWFLDSLPWYDVIATPRTSNVEDFHRVGCREVHHVRFGYDETLLEERAPTALPSRRWSVLFVGGGDDDRRRFFGTFRRDVPETALIGAYWERWPETRDLAFGGRPPDEVAWLTRRAPVSLILVRRANRDGHVMRTFEAAAAGGCLLVEDTADHRAIFGSDGECVRYFESPSHAARICRELLDDPAERQRLAQAARDRILAGRHTYMDRLRELIDIAMTARGKPSTT